MHFLPNVATDWLIDLYPRNLTNIQKTIKFLVNLKEKKISKYKSNK